MAAAPDIKILVVDDSAIMRRIIKNHLAILGYKNIREAPNGRKALEVLSGEKIDLILSDWCMQGMYGIDLLRAVRTDTSLANIPFIMISAEAQQHFIDEAFDEKVNSYIIKPFTREMLEKQISEVLIDRV